MLLRYVICLMTNLFTKYAEALSHREIQNQITKFNPPWMELGEFLWSADTRDLVHISKKAQTMLGLINI